MPLLKLGPSLPYNRYSPYLKGICDICFNLLFWGLL
ncbi:hypothetical protein AAZX31_17G091300 [Glycine max]